MRSSVEIMVQPTPANSRNVALHNSGEIGLIKLSVELYIVPFATLKISRAHFRDYLFLSKDKVLFDVRVRGDDMETLKVLAQRQQSEYFRLVISSARPYASVN